MADTIPVLDVISTPPAALFKKRGAKKNTNIRKRPATPPPADSDDSGSEYSSEDETGRKVKRRRKNGVTISASTIHRPDTDSLQASKFAADKNATIEITNDATKQSDWYEGNGKNMNASQLLGKRRNEDASATPDGTYKGAAGYTNYIQKNPDAPQKKHMGPVKAATNIRTITVTDFAPDVCKDYKQTGFCGFGDSCKFLHAREDYKQGWELDRDWEIGTKGKKLKGTSIANANRGGPADDDEAADDALLESIPFACFICREPYKNPIITKCGHYFCEKCALDRYRKNPACAACGSGTGGVFNRAKNLTKLLERKRERAKKRKQKAREAGEEVSEDEEEDT
jgi:RING finger protein 113A